MKSKFTIFSILITLFINFLSGGLFWAVFIKSNCNPFDPEHWAAVNSRISMSSVLILETISLYFLFQLKQIEIENETIRFRHLFFPFIKKIRKFSDYDYGILVDEYTRSGYYETLWLIKNGRVKGDISSFYYSNYTKLKFEIKVRNKGKKKIFMFGQLFYRLGMKIE